MSNAAPGTHSGALSRGDLFTNPPNSDFVIDRALKIIIASPCSGHGAKFTPVLGQILADMIDGSAAPLQFRVPT